MSDRQKRAMLLQAWKSGEARVHIRRASVDEDRGRIAFELFREGLLEGEQMGCMGYAFKLTQAGFEALGRNYPEMVFAIHLTAGDEIGYGEVVEEVDVMLSGEARVCVKTSMGIINMNPTQKVKVWRKPKEVAGE